MSEFAGLLAPGGSPPAEETSTAGKGARASILMVDDHPAKLLTYEAILNGLDVACVRALSGEEALAKLLVQEFAVILLDVNMPGMDGFEVARLVRAHPRFGKTPIIFLTAHHVSEIDHLRGYEVGAIDYIPVPVAPEVLRSKVAILVELHRRRSQLEDVNSALAKAREQLVLEHARALAARDEKLRAVFDHPDQIGVVLRAERDVSGRVCDLVYLDANRNAERTLGIPRAQLLGRRLTEVLPDRSDDRIDLASKVLATAEPARYEARMRDVEMGVTLYPIGQDQLVLAAFDITDRKRAETAVRDSRESLVLAKTAARLGTFDWDIPNDSLVWDERTHELWGIEPAGPMKVASFFSQVHPDDHAAAQKAIDRSFDPQGDRRFEALYRVTNRVDGITRWVEATGRVYFDGAKPARMIGVVQEVTERMQAQQQLRESEQRFRELANNIDQFAWTCDASGRATWYNDRWHRYTGIGQDSVDGDTWQHVIRPDHLPRVAERFRRCLQIGQAYEDTLPLRDENGEYRWFLTRAVPIRDSEGRVLRWFGTNTDITEQRKLHEAMEQTDRRKDQFLAMLAHELRNPVAPIASAADALSRMLNDESSRRLATIIRRQAQTLSRLLDDLLDVARITQGRIHLHAEVVALDTCIALALETAEPLIRERRHELTIGRAPELLYVSADRVRLAQCLDNLLTNAAKYTEPGGEIRIRPHRDGDFAVVEVSDNGHGISPEFLPHMFELFAQSERTLDRAQGGLGIGLSVCRQLIEMQGGTVTGQSAGAGKGSTFTVRLPLAQPVENAPASANVSFELHRILIVDDNRDAADSLAMLLEFEGHRVHTAYSAEEALQGLTTFDPQIALLDIGLPGMNGYELARRLRELAIPGLRLIAVSGYGQPEDRARTAAAGFDAHLVKPVELEQLQVVLSTLTAPRRP